MDSYFLRDYFQADFFQSEYFGPVAEATVEESPGGYVYSARDLAELVSALRRRHREIDEEEAIVLILAGVRLG